MDVPIHSFSVLMENASHKPLSVTMMMTVEMEVMKTLAVWLFFPTFFNCFIKNWFKQMAGSRSLGCMAIKSWPLCCKDFFVWKGENCSSTLIDFFQVVFAAKCLGVWLQYEFARFSDILLPNPYSFTSSGCCCFLISVWPKGNSFTLKSQLPTACYWFFKCVCLFHILIFQ